MHSYNPLFHLLLQPSSQHQRPSMILLNTRLLLNDIADKYGQYYTVPELPEEILLSIIQPYDYIWFMGIYKPSGYAQQIAEKNFDYFLKDHCKHFSEKDIVASPFAIPSYDLNPRIASSWHDWDEKVMNKLHKYNKKIIIDFVPNHVAPDHFWIKDHPEWFISKSINQIKNDEQFMFSPDEYEQGQDKRRIAYGNFYGSLNIPWIDTVQLNYANPQLQLAQQEEVLRLSQHCDGIRCDMAHLLIPEIYLKQWRAYLSDEEIAWCQKNPFWLSLIPKLRQVKAEQNQTFQLIAEVYGDTEMHTLATYGFDVLYEKTGLYDDLVKNNGNAIKNRLDHLENITTYQPLKFIENHDEDRARNVFGKQKEMAAAAIAALAPKGWFMVNEGQVEGRALKVPMQIDRYCHDEQPDENLKIFYENLFAIRNSTIFQQGIPVRNSTHKLHPDIVAIQSSLPGIGGLIVCTNYSAEFKEGQLHMHENGEYQVFSLQSSMWLAEARHLTDIDTFVYIGLRPWETQILVYKLSG